MGYCGEVLCLLVLVAVSCASVKDNTINGERVFPVLPVLAPPRDSRTQPLTRASQFPILVLLAQQNPQYEREHEAKSLEHNPQPIYIKKLKNQENSAGLSRQRRHAFKKGGGTVHSFGGGGNYGGYPHNTCGGGGGGGGRAVASANANANAYSGGNGKR